MRSCWFWGENPLRFRYINWLREKHKLKLYIWGRLGAKTRKCDHKNNLASRKCKPTENLIFPLNLLTWGERKIVEIMLLLIAEGEKNVAHCKKPSSYTSVPFDTQCLPFKLESIFYPQKRGRLSEIYMRLWSFLLLRTLKLNNQTYDIHSNNLSPRTQMLGSIGKILILY